MLQTIIFFYLIQGMQGHASFPLDSCTSGDIDVILHISSVNQLQKIRLANLVKLFKTENDLATSGNRISLFLNQNLTEPFVGFNSLKNTDELLNKLENLQTFEQLILQPLEILIWISDEYFHKNYILNSIRTKIIIIFCETCIYLVDNDNTLLHKLNFAKVFIVAIHEFESMNWLLQKYINIMFISQTDDLKNNQFLSLALCGQCNPGWLPRIAVEETDIKSCYKLDFVDSLVSHNAANQLCETLGAHIVMIETTDELDFVKKMLSSILKNRFNGVRELLPVGLCNIAFKPIQIFELLQSLVNHTIEQDRCFSLGLTFNFSSLHLTWIPVHPKNEDAKLVLCEFDFRFYFLRKHKANPFFIYDNETDAMTLMNNKLLETDVPMYFCNDENEVIPYAFFNDGYNDCGHGEDELEVLENIRDFSCFNYYICSTVGYQANNRMFCIKKIQKCNGIVDCPDGEDESNCNECMETSLSDGTCLPSQWFYDESRRKFSFSRRDKPLDLKKIAFVDKVLSTCNTIECVHENKVFLEIINCKMEDDIREGKDVLIHKLESDTSEIHDAGEHQKRWAAMCVHLRGRYNGQYLGCENIAHLKECEQFLCSDGLFKCPMSYCVPYHMLNDGVIDCPNGEDEFIDDLNQIYIENFFKCRASKRLIHPVHVCDGKEHCPTGDDESLCYDHCPAGFMCDWGVLTVSDPNSISHNDVFRDLDFNVKFINIGGIDFSRFKSLQINVNTLADLRLPKCNLTSEILNVFLKAMNIITHVMLSVDLSQNPLQKIPVNLFVTRDLYLYQTSVLSFTIDTHYLKLLDISNSPLQNLTISGKFPFYLNFVNLSNTNLKTIVIENIMVSIYILDLTNTHIIYNTAFFENFKKICVIDELYGDNFKLCCSVISGKNLIATKCSALEDPISSCYGLLGDIYKRTLSMTLAVLGLIGNIFLIPFEIMYVNVHINYISFRLYQTHLLVSDLLMNVYQLIISGADLYYLQSYVMYDIEWMESPLCMTAGLLATLSYISSAFFLLLLSLDQVVMTPPAQDNIKSRLVFVVSTIAVWCIGLIVSLLPLLKPDWMIYSANSMCLGLPYYVIDSTGWMFSVCVFCMFFTLTVIVSIAFFIKLKSSSIKIALTIENNENNMGNVKSLLLISILFWFPVCVTSFVSAIDQTVPPRVIGFVSVFVVPLKSAINPYTCICPLSYRKWIDFKNGKINTAVAKPKYRRSQPANSSTFNEIM